MFIFCLNLQTKTVTENAQDKVITSALHVPPDGVLKTKLFSQDIPAGFSSHTGSNGSFIYEELILITSESISSSATVQGTLVLSSSSQNP